MYVCVFVYYVGIHETESVSKINYCVLQVDAVSHDTVLNNMTRQFTRKLRALRYNDKYITV